MDRIVKLVFAMVAAAVPVAASQSDAEPSSLRRAIDQEMADSQRRIIGLTRVRLGHPQRLSGGLGMMVSRQPASFDCVTVCEYRGWLFQLEPGQSGAQVSAGYAVVLGEKRRREHFLSRVYLGYGAKVALLRTWGDARPEPDDQALLGVEGDFTIIGVNFSLGVFRHIGIGDPDDPWLVTGGLGWGF